MAIMINPNAIQKGSITKEMLTQGARRPIILTSSTTEVDEETYQKLLSDDVDVVFKAADGNLCTLTFANFGISDTLNFTCLSMEGNTMADLYIYGYSVAIDKNSPHICHITEDMNNEFASFLNEAGYLNKYQLSPVLQEIDLSGTDAERKAKLTNFETDWKTLTGKNDLNGARFVGRINSSESNAATVLLQYNSINVEYEGISISDDIYPKIQTVRADPVQGYLTITPLFSHLEPVEIFTDNSVASKQKNIDNLNAYKSNLAELGVDTNKSFQVPFREGDKATFIGTLQYSVDTNTYIGVGCTSDEDTARIIRISSTGESTITNLARADNLSRVIRDLGMYPELDPVPLNSEVTGKYINSEGKYVDARDWNIASIGAVSLGNTYLLNMVSSTNMVLGVALFVSRVYKRDKEGNIIGTTLTPLFSAKNTSIPASGYVLFEAMDDYDEVLVCYKPALTTQMLVARWGFKASNATQLRNLRMIVDNKTDFEGIYELLTAGYALNLVGKGNGEPQAFMSRKTGGGNITDGSAVIKEVDGVQPIVWNQLVTNGDFSSSLDGWTASNGSNTIVDGMLEFTADSSENNNKGPFLVGMKAVIGHKYIIAFDAKATTQIFIYLAHGMSSGTSLWIRSDTITTNKSRQRLLWTNSDLTSFSLGFRWISNNISQKLYLDNIVLIDLTQMFGAGNEPSTYEEYLDRISHYHIEDEYAYNAGEVVNYKGVGIKTTNIDGTKTYIRDWNEVMKKYFPDGMTSLNGVKDFFDDKMAVRKYGVVDLGEFEWDAYSENRFRTRTDIEDIKLTDSTTVANIFAPNYKAVRKEWVEQEDMQISVDGRYIMVCRRSVADATALKAAMQGVKLYYELAEPVEDIFDKELNLTYTVINGGTETSLATENSTQFEGSIAYNKDYVAVVDELQIQNRVTQIEFENWEN